MRAVYWITDWIGWALVELSDAAPWAWLGGPLYRLGNWFYGVRP